MCVVLMLIALHIVRCAVNLRAEVSGLKRQKYPDCISEVHVTRFDSTLSLKHTVSRHYLNNAVLHSMKLKFFFTRLFSLQSAMSKFMHNIYFHCFLFAQI
jgi:hypothetical protein